MTLKVMEFEQRFDAKGNSEDWVKFAPADDMSKPQTWERVRHMKPPANIARDNRGIKAQAMHALWAMIEPRYDAWKKGVEVPETGTALGAWPALSKSQLEALRRAGFVTLEEFADASDGHVSKVPMPGIRALQQQAKMFTEGRDQAELQQTVVSQQEQIDALTATLNEMSKPEPVAEYKKYEGKEDLILEKPKRGRPKKETESA